jgi:drug/metabolite transporter (DMT)-like permease
VTESESGAQDRTLGLLFAVAGALGFAFKAIFVKAAYMQGVDAETLLALRMSYALPLFLVMAWLQQRRSPVTLTRADWSELALLGFLGYYLSSYLDFLGLRHVSAALERIILYVYPSLVVLLSALFLRRPLTARTLRLLALCYGGVALSVAPDVRLGGRGTVLGAVLVFASALSFAVYLMRCGEVMQRLGSTLVTAYATGVACLLCGLQFVLLRPLSSLARPWPVHAYGAAMAVFSTVLPVWLANEGIRRLGAATAAMVGSLGPVLTILLAAGFLGEPLNALQLVGAVVVILAVSRLARAPSRAPRKPA